MCSATYYGSVLHIVRSDTGTPKYRNIFSFSHSANCLVIILFSRTKHERQRMSGVCVNARLRIYGIYTTCALPI